MKTFLGEFEELILRSIIFLGNKTYGVEIADLIEEKTGKRVSTGAIYTALKRLEKKKFISSKLGSPTDERGGRAKNIVSVEGAGMKALQESDTVRQEFKLQTAM